MLNLKSLFVLLIFLQFVSCTTRPIIGILAQETVNSINDKNYNSLIGASYVEAVEASGARVVPVFIDQSLDYYVSLSLSLNGFLFPGGDANITADTGYARSGKIIFDLVKKRNEIGVVIPILGICLGMELLGFVSTNGTDLRTNCSVQNEALSLKFENDFKQSSLFADISQENFETLSRLNSTINFHNYCTTEETIKYYELTDMWRILTTSRSEKSKRFISSMEMKSFPVVALQFHPEKNAFEWNWEQANPHDNKSIKAARLFSDWLVSQARKNNQSVKTRQELMDLLIYNYKPTFTGKEGEHYYQTYYFNTKPSIEILQLNW